MKYRKLTESEEGYVNQTIETLQAVIATVKPSDAAALKLHLDSITSEWGMPEFALIHSLMINCMVKGLHADVIRSLQRVLAKDHAVQLIKDFTDGIKPETRRHGNITEYL